MSQVHAGPDVPINRATLHDHVRPGWSVDVVTWLLGSPPPDLRLAVVDLGAGTGLGTRSIANLGHRVTAVEPSEDMLSVLRKACQGLPVDVAERITATGGSAERIPLDNGSVDAIICLQAWHWVNPKFAVPECDRVLRDGGRLGLAWHTWDRASAWVAELAAIVEPDGAPADQTGSVPGEFAGRGRFERKDFPFVLDLPVEQLVNLARSWAFVAQRADREDVLAKIRRLGVRAASPETGLVSFPHITAAFRAGAQKTGSAGLLSETA